jgi:tryptophanyl-tRNA synthetase
MSVRSEIMALPSDPTGKCEPHEDYFDGIAEGYKRCKRDAADIAEAREKELQERMANIINELKEYLQAASDGSMSRNNSEQLAFELLCKINKYEAL